MGLKLRLCLFHGVSHEDVLSAYQQFYSHHNLSFAPKVFEIGSFHQFEFYEQVHDWVVVGLDGGWERTVRQEAYLSVSQLISCAGFFIYVYDGDYWGYELFNNGIVYDQFVNESEPGGPAYCDATPRGCNGDAAVIKSILPFLDEGDLSPYLVRETYEYASSDVPIAEQSRRYHEYLERVDIPPRSGDEFTRFDECSVLNFLRMLGVEVELRDHYVTFLAPLFGAFELGVME